MKIIIVENCKTCPFLWERVSFSGAILLNYCKLLSKSVSEQPIDETFPIPEECTLQNKEI
jgi:hypothetical protein